ncbi:TadE/TadG family type IV pilus assembly protein [Methylobacterium sp. NEAU K]|uniref:TadE/TadG family type IV pilus assembly protein n=1 Tax=Methylobacterium sp. NEAU K TaxID=3064946 RepID=UPI0027370FC8|nr:pilus assembly protein TadG-related protein [Methylobacterium sp. NEAU K]MDP4002061.1 pilus assembly protein TadG-related protein [Methylobacterium sp. NEAU K]
MSRLLTRARRLVAQAASLPGARSGNVTILFALSLLPMVGLIGYGVDYGVAITDKAKLDAAADTAAIAAVATAKAYIAANPNQTNVTANAIAAGIAQATSAFTVNAGTVPFAQVQLQTPQLTRTSQTLNATVVYTATVKNNFGQIFRTPTTIFTNTVTASVDLASYLDFYLLLDVSGSMGLPATTSGMSQLAANNRDMWSDYKQGCQFACHYPGFSAWTYATTNKIQLRSDAVNNAVCALIQRASSPSVTGQYRVGLYPFINQMGTLADVNSTISTLNSKADCASSWPLALSKLLDTGTTQLFTGKDPSTGTGAGGTHFEVVMPQMKTEITNAGGFGDGSSTSARKPFVFLVTDGMQNGQHYSITKNSKYYYPGNPSSFPGYAAGNFDGSSPSQIDPSLCTALKTAGATISILYIPYNIISYTDYGGTVAWENGRVNGFSPTLSTPLQSCASPGFFYTANTPADITASLSAMFDKAIQVARLTQ